MSVLDFYCFIQVSPCISSLHRIRGIFVSLPYAVIQLVHQSLRNIVIYFLLVKPLFLYCHCWSANIAEASSEESTRSTRDRQPNVTLDNDGIWREKSLQCRKTGSAAKACITRKIKELTEHFTNRENIADGLVPIFFCFCLFGHMNLFFLCLTDLGEVVHSFTTATLLTIS